MKYARLAIYGMLLGLLSLSGCFPKRMHEVTIAFPHPNIETEGKMRQFQYYLEKDSEKMIQNMRMEGLPERTVRIELEVDKLHAYGVWIADVKAALEPIPIAHGKWDVSEDSLVWEVLVADLDSTMSVREFEPVVLRLDRGDLVVMPMLGDVAGISDSFRFSSIEVGGQPCAVIRGTTAASLKEVELWLRGLDQMLGVKYFVVLED
jgi:hypothetical protein